VSDDLHTPTTAAPTPAGADAAGATSSAPATESSTATSPPPVTPPAPDAREGLADQKSTTDKLREKVPEPVVQAAETAVAKVTAARDSVQGGASGANQAPADRPEILVGAAFAGGFLAALILKRLGR
jgi:hypothetical protein